MGNQNSLPLLSYPDTCTCQLRSLFSLENSSTCVRSILTCCRVTAPMRRSPTASTKEVQVASAASSTAADTIVAA